MAKNLQEIVFNTIIEHNMLKNAKNVIVACSGGADSMALLHVLNILKDKFEITIKAAHLNHNLRGEDSLNDAKTVKDYCSINDIFLYESTLNWDDLNKNSNSENALRNLRYEFFEKVLCNEKNAVIATAHNKNDNAETLFFNIIRGSSLKGACAIPYLRKNIIRPLLDANRIDIEAYLNQNNIQYCFDKTNNSLQYSRNRIRHNIMPEVLNLNPSALNSISRFIKNAQCANDYINLQANLLLKKAEIKNAVNEKGYNAEILGNAHDAVLSEVCRILISQYIDASESKIEFLKHAIIEKTGALELNKNVTINVSQGFLRLQTKINNDNSLAFVNKNLPIPLNKFKNSDYLTNFNGEKLFINITNYENSVNFHNFSKNHLKNVADYGKIDKSAIFRTISANDKFCPMFSNCTKLLKKIYSENKFSLDFRKNNLILAIDNEVLWVYGLGFSNKLRIIESTKKIITINNNFSEVHYE